MNGSPRVADLSSGDEVASEGVFHSIRKRGLGRTLVFWFLLLALVPLVLVSGISYELARGSLWDSTVRSLHASTRQKKAFIENWFHYRFLDLEVQATSLENLRFLQVLSHSFDESGKTLEEFVGSYSWAKIVDDHGNDLKSIRRIYGYQNILLIDSSGNILYSVNAKMQAGTNLFQRKVGVSSLALASRRALRVGAAVFSDYERYESAADASGFLVSPIVDDEGDKIGLIAFQFSSRSLDKIMQQASGLGETGSSYLVGLDGLLRSNTIRDNAESVLRRKLDTEQIRRWQKFVAVSADNTESNHDKNDAFIYIGPAGKRVLGHYEDLHIANVSWRLIAEIDEAEAFAVANELKVIVFSLILVTIFVVLFSSFTLVDRILAPLRTLAGATKRVARGQYDQELVLSVRNEIGELAASFQNMLNALRASRQRVDADTWFQTGIMALANVLTSGQDVNMLSQKTISFLAKFLEAQLGSIYLFDEDDQLLVRSGSFAMPESTNDITRVKVGEGITGQAAFEKEMIIVRDIPDSYPKISSVLGEAAPGIVVATPIYLEDRLIGVIELAWFHDFSEDKATFLQDAIERIALAIHVARIQEYLLISEARTRSVVETALDAIITIDEDGAIHSSNPAAEKMFGYAGGELVGKDISVLAAVVSDSEHATYLMNYLRSGVRKMIGIGREIEAVRSDGTTFPAHLSVGEVRLGGKLFFNGFIRDVSTDKKAEADIKGKNSELEANNDRLKAQTRQLKESEFRLQSQQEELRQTNEELEEQGSRIERQNVALQEIQCSLEERAEELERMSQFKSEFLANMSHELRTPLNSLLVLSQLLCANKEGNLTGKQLESIRTIHDGGKDLLVLINDILDLSKVEAGMVDLVYENVGFQDLARAMERQFEMMVSEKSLEFYIDVDDGLPASFETDIQRSSQILKNLISNAIKFTTHGSIHLRICAASADVEYRQSDLVAGTTVAFAVSDTGIGIAAEKISAIFEAFVQADGSTSRHYGGTGLGLSISQQFAAALGGEIQVKSVEGQGSTFTLYLPDSPCVVTRVQSESLDTRQSTNQAVNRIRGNKPDNLIAPVNDHDDPDARVRSILIIEDDAGFAGILSDLAKERGFSSVVAQNGEEGLFLADYHLPKAIILDIGLPGIDGWGVMDRLRQNPRTRHIPVHFISGVDYTTDAFQMGAIGALTKPVSLEQLEDVFSSIDKAIGGPVKTILIVGEQVSVCQEIVDVVDNEDVRCEVISDREQACSMLKSGTFDCVIIHVQEEDSGCLDLLEKVMLQDELCQVPVVFYSDGDDVNISVLAEIQNRKSMTVHLASSLERLLDETVLFLHRIESELPAKQREMLKLVHDKESLLRDKKILVVDDDMRNIFALSAALEDKGMKVVIAKNGVESLVRLQEHPDVDLVLMDIMMPEMDGYEATTKIRQMTEYAKLPIIALTANAMAGDREKCLEAGATDYLAKPVDVDRLISLLRVWLYR